jgi:hypothetical protein
MTKLLVSFAAGGMFTLASPAFAYETKIQGEFHGWDGNSVYELMDGSVIKQINYHYHYHYAYNPDVIIYECSGPMCKIHVKDDDDDEEVAVEKLNRAHSYIPTPQYVPVPPQPQPVAPTPTQHPNSPVAHSIWNMTCYAKDGSTYEFVWQSNLQSLLIRRTGKTFVAAYHGHPEQLSPSAFNVVATGYGRKLTAVFGGESSSLSADRNSDGSIGGIDTCSITGGSG